MLPIKKWSESLDPAYTGGREIKPHFLEGELSKNINHCDN